MINLADFSSLHLDYLAFRNLVPAIKIIYKYSDLFTNLNLTIERAIKIKNGVGKNARFETLNITSQIIDGTGYRFS